MTAVKVNYAKCIFAASLFPARTSAVSFEMSEVKEWLASMGIVGIKRLSGVFESQGFSSRKSLQYLDEGDLDYMFSSPKKLRLAEK